MPEIIVNGVTLRYELHGTGPSVVLIPGGCAEMGAFRPLANHLAPSYRVLIHDRRNCGASDVAIDPTLSEVELWADDLHALVGCLEMSPAYVGGESAGCTVSVHLARRHPQDVKGLLLLWPATSDPAIKGSYGLLPLVGVSLLLNILTEELYFRAWMLPKLSRYRAWGWVMNGVLFALYHTFQLWLLPTLLVMSLLVALVFYRSKSIWPPLAAHLIGNFLLSTLGVLILIVG